MVFPMIVAAVGLLVTAVLAWRAWVVSAHLRMPPLRRAAMAVAMAGLLSLPAWAVGFVVMRVVGPARLDRWAMAVAEAEAERASAAVRARFLVGDNAALLEPSCAT